MSRREAVSGADPACDEVLGVDMTGRRDPFDKTETPNAAQPPSLYDSLRVAAPRKRNRQWEKQQQNRKVVYRGIDPKLALKVKTIADDLLVPAGEVACAVLEYALRSYERGDYDLHPLFYAPVGYWPEQHFAAGAGIGGRVVCSLAG